MEHQPHTLPKEEKNASDLESIHWKVEGMDCTNCALSINNSLKKEGAQNIRVDFIGGDVSFQIPASAKKEKYQQSIEGLGYKVSGELATEKNNAPGKLFFQTHFQRFVFCLPFTLVLMLHMIHWPMHSTMSHFIMNPWIQLIICLPVFIVGMSYFGKSAWKNLRRGIPNMNLLIALGAGSAFVYSLAGSLLNLGMEYTFYETSATIFTLVFLGEYIENRSVALTQKELKKLTAHQKIMANMIAFDEQHQEIILPVENDLLRVGDLILIKTGEQVPADCKILWGEASVNEALLTGESNPVSKQKKETLIGGSALIEGTIKAQVTAVGKDSVLGSIIKMVKDAQAEKPPIQELADKISAKFVPLVLLISVATFCLNYWMMETGATAAIMRSIAVMVISCPCAMGLATPAAIAVGLGRGAKSGVLFRNAKSLELFKNIKTIVFDKTGTLTKGKFAITAFDCGDIDKEEFKQIVYSLEKLSSHPIAASIAETWKTKETIAWKVFQEIKGIGLNATDHSGNLYSIGSYKSVAHLTTDNSHAIYVTKNKVLLGWINLEDEIREEAAKIIQSLQRKNIQTIILSGDSYEKTSKIAAQLGIPTFYAEKTPEEKAYIIQKLNQQQSVAMVGDGINDAPALAQASIGISLSDASHLAMQSAQVVLMNNGLVQLPLALSLGKATYQTIKGNLFWAFIYNINAIPIAAAGLLSPGIAALAMGLSDIVLAINSIRLNYKNLL